ncbi:MAG: hypothetical protein NC418_00290 [Muribaculaceae bacterium]|nr:hypothetical protein [Muribaculaceae bacterium]
MKIRLSFILLLLTAIFPASGAETSPLEIVCADSNDGKVSAYTEHQFALSESVDNAEWIFKVLITDDEEKVVSESTGTAFTIPAIGDNDEYPRSTDGIICAVVECTYVRDGEENTATYKLSLELKPVIHGIYNLEKKYSDDGDYFTASFDVEFSGSDCLWIYVEEEYSSTRVAKFFTEPSPVHVSTSKINALYYSWIDIKVNNSYGSASETIESAPTYLGGSSSLSLNNIDENSLIDVYSISGNLIGKFAPEEFRSANLRQGIYILNVYAGSKLQSVRKHVVR